MILFIDIDGTMFDTFKNNPKNVMEWIDAYNNAEFIQGVDEALDYFDKKGNVCIAVTSRGLNGFDQIIEKECGVDMHRHTMKLLTNKLFRPTNIRGLGSKVGDKGGFIINNLVNINQALKIKGLKSDFKIDDAVLIDDDLDEVAYAGARGIKSILFAPLSKEDKISIDGKLPSNVYIANDWVHVTKIVDKISEKIK